MSSPFGGFVSILFLPIAQESLALSCKGCTGQARELMPGAKDGISLRKALEITSLGFQDLWSKVIRPIGKELRRQILFRRGFWPVPANTCPLASEGDLASRHSDRGPNHGSSFPAPTVFSDRLGMRADRAAGLPRSVVRTVCRWRQRRCKRSNNRRSGALLPGTALFRGLFPGESRISRVSWSPFRCFDPLSAPARASRSRFHDLSVSLPLIRQRKPSWIYYFVAQQHGFPPRCLRFMPPSQAIMQDSLTVRRYSLSNGFDSPHG